MTEGKLPRKTAGINRSRNPTLLSSSRQSNSSGVLFELEDTQLKFAGSDCVARSVIVRESKGMRAWGKERVGVCGYGGRCQMSIGTMCVRACVK